jgi:hypothetical protein
MLNKEENLRWLGWKTEELHSAKNGIRDVVEDFDDMGRLGSGFLTSDKLEEVDIGSGSIRRPSFVNINLTRDQKRKMLVVLREFIECFA